MRWLQTDPCSYNTTTFMLSLALRVERAGLSCTRMDKFSATLTSFLSNTHARTQTQTHTPNPDLGGMQLNSTLEGSYTSFKQNTGIKWASLVYDINVGPSVNQQFDHREVSSATGCNEGSWYTILYNGRVFKFSNDKFGWPTELLTD